MSTDTATETVAQSAQEVKKLVHTILLDTSPILLNTPSISTLLANSHELVTTQSVIDEIRGEEARNRLETLYRPFLTIRSPKPESIKLLKDFARKTGDSGVLSSTDFEILALAYDLECERNQGDWRLRSAPGQKRLNGSPPTDKTQPKSEESAKEVNHDKVDDVDRRLAGTTLDTVEANEKSSSPQTQEGMISGSPEDAQSEAPIIPSQQDSTDKLEQSESPASQIITEEDPSDSDDGWITPSNIKKHQAREDASIDTTKSETRTLQVATMTGDFAMQNVLLQMNLNLLSTKTCKRVANVKQMILRCHACFATTKDMSKQFCPRCGGPTLTRVTCTTNDKGEVKLHLKANHQWNNKGNVYSVPKPTSGSANQKWKGPQQGGGKGGWGNGLILAEDQKEYMRANSQAKRVKNKDLMDEDVLPSILTGDRDRSNGRIRVGAGRSINSRKR